MTDIADARACPARLPRHSPRRRRSSGPCRSATGRPWPGTSATRRRPPTPRRRCWSTGRAWSSPVRLAHARSRSTSSSSAPGVTTLARGELITAIELPAPTGPRGGSPRPADETAGPRPRLGDAGLRGDAGRGDPDRATAASGRDRCSSSTRAVSWPTRPRRTGPRCGASRRCSSRPARPRGRCGRVRNTASRCSTSSGSGRSRPRSSGWMGFAGGELHRDRSARGAGRQRARASRSRSNRSTRCSRSCATRPA